PQQACESPLPQPTIPPRSSPPRSSTPLPRLASLMSQSSSTDSPLMVSAEPRRQGWRPRSRSSSTRPHQTCPALSAKSPPALSIPSTSEPRQTGDTSCSECPESWPSTPLFPGRTGRTRSSTRPVSLGEGPGLSERCFVSSGEQSAPSELDGHQAGYRAFSSCSSRGSSEATS